MEGYTLGIIIKAVFDYLLKAGSAGLPVVGGGAVIVLLWQGLKTAKEYTKSSGDERTALLAFIKTTQDRQDRREDAFLSTLQGIDKNLAGLSQRFEDKTRRDEVWQAQAGEKFDKINEDVWKARG